MGALDHLGAEVDAGDGGAGKVFLQTAEVASGAAADLQDALGIKKAVNEPKDGFAPE
jgi:hypothetical protein